MTIYDHEILGSDITARHNSLAKLLATGLSYAKAGEQIGVSESTVYRAMRNPNMRALVDSWRRQHIDGVLAQLIPEGIRSISFLAATRDDPDEPTYLRVKCAQELLAALARLTRQTTLSELPPEQAKALLRSELERIVSDRGPNDDDR